MSSAKRKRVSSRPVTSKKELQAYFKSYKGGGIKDVHYPVFQAMQEMVSAKRVLYPGCHRHLTASLIFPHVTFVDCDQKVASLYTDEAAKSYVEESKSYGPESYYEFITANVLDKKAFLHKYQSLMGTYDLLISLSAGVIAAACTKFVKDGGYLLVNDSHSDARYIFANHSKDWRLLAYWNGNDFSTEDLDKCFRVVSKKMRLQNRENTQRISVEPAAISTEQVEESVKIGSVSKRSFSMMKDCSFYVFQKVKTGDDAD